ncbi:MAG: hypothetical protein L6V93_15790 [Clostridiales bacterium]|nr:MAG: hypothetical protein L6V93_15790 [Clostridiales bacterium]
MTTAVTTFRPFRRKQFRHSSKTATPVPSRLSTATMQSAQDLKISDALATEKCKRRRGADIRKYRCGKKR